MMPTMILMSESDMEAVEYIVDWVVPILLFLVFIGAVAIVVRM